MVGDEEMRRGVGGENLPANIEKFGMESCSVGGICEEIGVVVRVFYGTFVLFFFLILEIR